MLDRDRTIAYCKQVSVGSLSMTFLSQCVAVLSNIETESPCL